MAGYDPRRPRPIARGDEPAPIEALIDLADSDAPASHAQASPARSDSGGPGSAVPASAPEPVAQSVPPSVPDGVPPAVEPRGDRAVGRGRAVAVGVLVAVATVLLIVALRRRRN